MAGSFQTTVQDMKVAAQKVQSVADQIKADTDRLNNQIEPIASTWKGAGSTAYFQLHRQWMDSVGRLYKVLGEISQGIDRNANLYQQSEDEVIATMNQTTATLG